MSGKTCNKCGAEGCEWDMEFNKQYNKWRLQPHYKPNTQEYCVKPLGKKMINPSDSNDPKDPNYVNPEPCIACKYYGRKCYSNQRWGHCANW